MIYPLYHILFKITFKQTNVKKKTTTINDLLRGLEGQICPPPPTQMKKKILHFLYSLMFNNFY